MKAKYSVKGMVCSNCADSIKKILMKHPGIEKVHADYDSKSLTIDFKPGSDLSLSQLNSILEKQGYSVSEGTQSRKTLFAAGAVMLLLGLVYLSREMGFSEYPQISDNMSYAMLFLAGVLTSFHCIAMCGGIALSQSITTDEGRSGSLLRSVKYNLGRVMSYTLLGGVIGTVGSVVSIGGSFRGVVSIAAGAFMIVLSLNMLGLTRFRVPKLPAAKVRLGGSSNNGPFIIGLANGFMPCGPLQTMQLYALGTGSLIGGMSSMFFFSLGTVPLMLGFGMFATLLSRGGGRKFVKASSVVVLLLGIIMINRGLLLGGYGVSFNPGQQDYVPETGVVAAAQALEGEASVVSDSDTITEESPEAYIPYQIVDGVQVIRMTVKSDRYELSSPLVAGIPARIEIDIEGINRCNSPVLIPKAGVEVDLLRDEPVMEFIPEETGDLRVTCWMGMITTNAKIVEAIAN